MKKIFTSVLLVAGLLTTPVINTNAMISGGGSTFTMTSALYLASGGGSFIAGGSMIQWSKKMKKKSSRILARVAGGFLIFLGVILMDEEGELTGFKEIDVDGEIATSLIETSHRENWFKEGGLVRGDLLKYNEEVSDLNMAISSAKAICFKETGEDCSEDELVNYFKEEFDFSPATLKVASALSVLSMSISDINSEIKALKK